MTRLTMIAFGAAAALVGCGGNKVDELYDRTENVAREVCQCEALTMEAESVCLAEFEADVLPTEAELECLRAAYDRNEDAAKAALDCQIDVADDWVDCLDRAACNSVAVDSCSGAAEARVVTCPSAPPSVEAELGACFGG